ncbi:GTP-binding protein BRASSINAZOLE INSENSITIVE PALE GREEN 2, chloroplastic [Linum grandiflorum]
MVFSRSLSVAKSKLKPLFSLSRFSQTLQNSSSIPSTPSPASSSSPFTPSYFSTAPAKPKQPPPPSSLLLSRDGNVDDSTPSVHFCPGCGIHMQDSDPKNPGFFVKPSAKDPSCYKPSGRLVPIPLESQVSSSLKSGSVIESERGSSVSADKLLDRPVVCARCHSLRHYGKVKDPSLENLLPEFDFYHTVGKRLVSSTGARTVVLLVVDASDFDGSFPKRLAKLVTEAIDENYTNWKEGKSGNVPRIVLVVTKIDLLPTSLSPTRFEHWVRQRARDGGAAVIKKVHFVSPVKNWGLKDLVEDVKELAGARGHVWAVGMQNAGKSTLLNAMAKCAAGGGGVQPKITHLTEAPVPGTTLGIIRVDGLLPGNTKVFDTPGLLNPNQITTRLTRDEQKLVNITKELKPRTYRIKVGHSVHISGLMRVDIEQLSVDSVYVTVWASPYLPLHMGKTENVGNMLEEHFGRQLQPPIGEKRVEELGKWARQEFHVSGNSWDSSSVDIAAGGLGWFGIGLKGDAVLGVWTYEGVDVVLRNSLIPYRAETFEVAGFTVSKIVSKADQGLNRAKSKSEKKNKKQSQGIEVAAADAV